MNEICCFGELLMRLCPDGDGNWLKTASMKVYTGGAEANVAGALAKWEDPVKYCSVVPDNYVVRQMVDSLQEKKIDVSAITYAGDKLGIYILPVGSELKNAGVIYDRAGSSFTLVKPGTVDWNAVLEGVSLFHFSAISPGLSQQAADLCLEAVQAAANKGITVSVDLNYRQKLWKYGKTPIAIMPELASHCSIIMGNVWAAERMLGITTHPDFEGKTDKKSCLEQSARSSEAIISGYPKCKWVANTFRFGQGSVVDYYGTLFCSGKLFVSEQYHTENVVDKVGSGDCFMAGLLHGYFHEWNQQRTIDFSAAAAFDKLFISGDATTSSEKDIISAYLKQ